MDRLLNLLIAVDQLAYVVITLGVGKPDETMSAAAWRTEQKGRRLGKFFRPIIDGIFKVLFKQQHHCRDADAAERLRLQSPEEQRV